MMVSYNALLSLVIVFAIARTTTGTVALQPCENLAMTQLCFKTLTNTFRVVSYSRNHDKVCGDVKSTKSCLQCDEHLKIMSTNFDDLCTNIKPDLLADCGSEKGKLDDCKKNANILDYLVTSMKEQCANYGAWKRCMDQFIDSGCKNPYDQGYVKTMTDYRKKIILPSCKKLGYPINASHGLQPAVMLLGAILVVFFGLI